MFTSRWKIALAVLGLIAFAMLLGGFFYWLLFSKTPVVTPVDEIVVDDGTASLPGSGDAQERVSTPSDSAPAAESDGLPVSDAVLLTTSPVESPVATGLGEMAFYDPSDGRFYRIDENGNLVALSSETFPDVEDVTFSTDVDMAAIEFPDGTNILYDFASDEQTTLPSHWEDFTFSPESEIVASKNITSNPDLNSIVVTSTDGTHTQVLAGLGTNAGDVTLDWSPTGDVIGYAQTGSTQSGFGREQIYLIGNDGEPAGSIVVEGLYFDPIWSPSGETILYSITDDSADGRPTIWSVDGNGADAGGDRTRYGVQTYVEKCSFATETIVYCAVPRELPDNAGFDVSLADAPDDVYKLNLTTGQTTLVAVPSRDYQMFNVSVPEDQSILYFTDEAGRLHRLELD